LLIKDTNAEASEITKFRIVEKLKEPQGVSHRLQASSFLACRIELGACS
jgi:hypothetical protein